MKLRSAVPLLLALAVPVFASASEFEDFRIPAHAWREWSISAGGSLHGNSGASTFQSGRNSTHQANGAAFVTRGYDSDPWQWDAAASGSVDWLESRRRTESYSQTPLAAPNFTSFHLGRAHFTQSRESWSLGAGGRAYPNRGRLGFEARGSVGGSYLQSWESDDDVFENASLGTSMRTESQQHRVSWEYRELARLDLSVGWGRVRDATGVFRAILMTERLERDRALLRPATPQALQKLAQLFTIQGDFGFVHDQPGKFFWAEVERVLREDGAIGESGLDAYQVLHATDALLVARSGFPRRVGWFAGPVVSAQHRHTLERSDVQLGSRSFLDGVLQAETRTTTNSRLRSSDETAFVGIQADYHRALATRTQLDLFERALVDFKGDPDQLQVEGFVSLSHLIGERWFANAQASHFRLLDNEPTLALWLVAASGQVAYFLEDNCRIELLLAAGQTSARNSAAGSRSLGHDHEVRLQVVLGRGRLDAPGLITPQRPMN